MNDDNPLSDVEDRLRAWRPTELPAELRARLHAACPSPRREVRWRRPVLAAACGVLALGAAAALRLNGRFAPSPEAGNPSAAASPGVRRAEDAEPAAQPRWLLGKSLTMNIYTGVPLGNVPAALRLDGEAVAGSGLIPLWDADGKLPLKVDCQF